MWKLNAVLQTKSWKELSMYIFLFRFCFSDKKMIFFPEFDGYYYILTDYIKENYVDHDLFVCVIHLLTASN